MRVFPRDTVGRWLHRFSGVFSVEMIFRNDVFVGEIVVKLQVSELYSTIILSVKDYFQWIGFLAYSNYIIKL